MEQIENKECCSTTAPKKCSKKPFVMWLIVVCTALTIASMYYLVWMQTNAILDKLNQKIDSIEAEKVGWEENYKLLKQIYSSEKYKDQQKQSFSQVLSQMWVDVKDTSNNENSWSETSDSQIDSSFKQWQFDAAKIAELKQWAYVKWNPQAKLTWIEYSDVECPFCKRFHAAWTVKSIVEASSWEINYIFQHFPLSFHPLAQKWAEAMECVWELAWNDAFYDFEDKVFSVDPSVENIEKIVKEMKIDSKKFKACLDSGKFAEKTAAQLAKWQELFSIQWTPGNVLINNETGKWVVVPWAYPASEFEKVIKYLTDSK